MNIKYQVKLSFVNIKSLKTGLTSTNFYLVAYTGEQVLEVTTAKDVLFVDEAFTISSKAPLTKLEVWNYSKLKKVGSLLFKGQKLENTYSHQFKNANILLELTSTLDVKQNKIRNQLKRKDTQVSTENEGTSDEEA